MKAERIIRVLIADLKFECKQGFFFIYFVISFIYLLVLAQIPESYRLVAVPFVVFSDPSVLGLFFVGGMLLLEKEQGILQSIVVTPLRSVEYVTGKILSLSLVALFAGFLITKLSITQSFHYGLLFIGILLTSCFFTQMGILVACRSKSINAFFLKMVPYMLVCIMPMFLLIPYGDWKALNMFPAVAGFRLVYGAYHGAEMSGIIFQIGYLLVVNSCLLMYTARQFENQIVYGGQNGQIDALEE